MCFSHFRLCECLVNVCVQTHVAQVSAGKDAVYKIGIIYLACGGGWREGGGCRGLPQQEISHHRKRKKA